MLNDKIVYLNKHGPNKKFKKLYNKILMSMSHQKDS